MTRASAEILMSDLPPYSADDAPPTYSANSTIASPFPPAYTPDNATPRAVNPASTANELHRSAVDEARLRFDQLNQDLPGRSPTASTAAARYTPARINAARNPSPFRDPPLNSMHPNARNRPVRPPLSRDHVVIPRENLPRLAERDDDAEIYGERPPYKRMVYFIVVALVMFAVLLVWIITRFGIHEEKEECGSSTVSDVCLNGTLVADLPKGDVNGKGEMLGKGEVCGSLLVPCLRVMILENRAE